MLPKIKNEQREKIISENIQNEDTLIQLTEVSDSINSKIKIKEKSISKKKLMVDHIPCLFLPYDDGATKILIYFHGNAEDIGLAFDLLYMIG